MKRNRLPRAWSIAPDEIDENEAERLYGLQPILLKYQIRYIDPPGPQAQKPIHQRKKARRCLLVLQTESGTGDEPLSAGFLTTDKELLVLGRHLVSRLGDDRDREWLNSLDNPSSMDD